MSGFGSAQLPKPGDIVDGKYRLEHLLGQGGMGAVFAARHIKLGHAVAIKVMLADSGNAEAAQRFINEGRAAANIQNDHVVRVSDVDEERGYAFMVLELLEGEDLSQVLDRESRLAPHVAVGYVLQALDGVKAAHAQGIVHRDLKPSNLFLARRQGANVVVKVLDFGISKANNASALDMAPSALTSTAAMLGSPLYMSPEQLRSSKKVDARADIWAMGVILFELLTGTLPFEGETLGALFAAILETDAPRVSSRIPNVPPGLDAVVVRCLQRRAEDRFQDVADLTRELAPYASPMGDVGAYTLATQPSSLASTAMAGPAHGYAPGSASQSSPGLGSGPHQVRGTVPLGAVTPQPQPLPLPHRQTGNTWQSTGSGQRPKSSGMIVAIGAICSVLLVVGIGLGVMSLKSWKAKQPGEHAAASGLQVTPAAPPSAIVVPDPSVTAPASATADNNASPTSSTRAVASASSPPAASTAPKQRPTTPSVPSVPATVVKVEPPKVEPPKVVTHPNPTPPPANGGSGTLQGNR
jgi:serine/threonine protein kinase